VTKAKRLRALPSVDIILRDAKVLALRDTHSLTQITLWVRAAVQECREHILQHPETFDAPLSDWIIDRVHRQSRADHGQRLQPVINATGVVLHTNLGRSPMSDQAIAAAERASRYTNVELNLESGRRSKRGERLMTLLSQLTGAEDALVVNNCAAATVLVLQAIAAGREVIVSRGQLVEIGGGFRLPDVFRAAGVTLREVGTTNRTYLRDYEAAVTESTGAVIRVHRSNFHLSGFVTEPSIDELVQMERPDCVAVRDDLGSGSMVDLSPYGLQEPNVLDSIQSGADLSLFSGDKLFGGPQAGILVGKKRWIETLRRSPIMRAMRVDKLTLAALEATTEIHLAGDALTELPTLRMITTSAEVVRKRCECLLKQIQHQPAVEIVPCESQVGGGSIPGSILPSYGVRILGYPPHHVAHQLRDGACAIQTRVTDESVMIDLRTVADHELTTLAKGINAALKTTQPAANTEAAPE
jgi:L-seryl-tRNA(Ser) seleniumtransferase